ncbi:MAG: hypothetical protein HQK96_10340 [Nitrospirae bacterium]|nr:hypothetical protein [Nitrospirota bacterium]
MEKKVKRVVYKVQCAKNPEHIFDKTFEIEEGTDNVESKAEAWCPHCGTDDMVEVTVKGRLVP